MKKTKLIFIISALLIFSSVFLTGCIEKVGGDDSQKSKVIYKELLADKEGTYSIVYIGNDSKDKTVFKLPDVMNEKSVKGTYLPTLEAAKEKYPKLDVNKSPVFLVYDTQKLVLQTSDEEKVKALFKK